ncbi:MAG: DUF3386 domain-containing protein [Acidobacteria bacterium]|nr:DUF3386 domain-containing protein [Acidobacteriota bacterium]
MKTIRLITMLALGLTVALAGSLPGAGARQTPEGNPNLADYYPLGIGDNWTYQVKQYRADGEIVHRLRTQSVIGETKIGEKTLVKKLMDDRGKYLLLSVDERRLRVHGENEGRGEVKFTPPYTMLDTGRAPGKTYAMAHLIGDEPVSSDGTYYGVESVAAPAGAFRDCLKLRLQITKSSGATTTITSFLAKGVGVVKETYEIFSPAAEQTVHHEIELLHGTVNGKKIGGEEAQTVKIAEYFPYHQGDSWTYDWSYRLANGQTRTAERKRWFEGTKFTNAGAAFKLMQSTGEEDYGFFLLDRNGLRLVESGEKGTRAQGVKWYFDPPLLIARDDMVIGRTYRWSMLKPGDKHLIQFSSTLEGFESVETPMGRFEKCLRAHVRWDEPESTVKNTYYYARGVGLVAYDNEVLWKSENLVRLKVTVRLKAATINHNTITTADEGKRLWDKMAADLAAAEDNPTARGLFKEASLNRYVWDEDLGFRGFTADLKLKIDGGATINAKMKCSPSLAVEIEAPDQESRALIHEEMSQFVTHRQPRKPFDAWYGPGKAKFKLGRETPDGHEIFIEGDGMGSNYIIGEKKVKQLTRNIGRMDLTIFQRRHQPVEDGRYIATEYEAVYCLTGAKQEVGRESWNDVYVKQGNYWVPKSRVHKIAMKGRPSLVELEVVKLDYLK